MIAKDFGGSREEKRFKVSESNWQDLGWNNQGYIIHEKSQKYA